MASDHKSGDPHPDPASDDRAAKVEAVVQEVLVKRQAGDDISDESVLSSHPELAPELSEELNRLRILERARNQMDAGDDSRRTATLGSQHQSAGSLRIRCPLCQKTIDVPPDSDFNEVTCDRCGGDFCLAGDGRQTTDSSSVLTFGQFELIERLGVGAFGTVWKARDNELQRTVAIKIPRSSDLEGRQLEKFLREARSAAQLKHPNIVSVYEVGRHEDTIYIVSELIRGVPLSVWLENKSLEVREAVELCHTLATALSHAHEQGVVHRDLKPANIIMDADGQPHITDFGLAKRETRDATLTVEGQVLGTPTYMSPEQAKGQVRQTDRRSDVYSLGVILFELMTDELPFRGRTEMLILQVIGDEPPSPRSLNHRIPRDLETICLKCLEKEPSKRYESSEELAADLARYLKDEPIHARPVGRIGRTWRWCRRNASVAILTSVAMLLLLTVAVVASVAYFSIAKEQRKTSKARSDREAAVETFLEEAGFDTLADEPHMTSGRRKMLQAAVRYYRQIAADEGNTDVHRVKIADAHRKVGEITRYLGDLKEAERSILSSNRIVDELLKGDSGNVDLQRKLAAGHFELAFILVGDERYDEAEQHFQTALKQFPIDGTHSLGGKLYYARVNLEYGLFQERRGESAEAERLVRKAHSLQAKLCKEHPDNADCLGWRATTLHELGLMLASHGKRDEAWQCYSQSLELREQLVKRNRSFQDQARLAGLLNDMASFKFYSDPSDAARDFLRSAELFGLMSFAFPTSPYYRDRQGSAYGNLAYLYSVQDKMEESRATWDKAMTILRKLVADYPERSDYRTTLAHSLQNRVSSMEAGKESQSILREALEIRQALVDEFPDHHKHQSNLGATLDGLGFVTFRVDGDVDEAIAFYRRAIVHQRRAIAASPENNVYQFFLFKHFHKLAFALHKAERHRESRQAWLEAIETIQGLSERNPNVETYGNWLFGSCNAFAWQMAHSPGRFRDLEIALKYAKSAVERAPENAAIINTLGVVHFRREEYSEAIPVFAKAQRLDKDSVDNYFYLAVAHARNGNLVEARRWLDEGLRRDMTDSNQSEDLRNIRREAVELISPGRDPEAPPRPLVDANTK